MTYQWPSFSAMRGYHVANREWLTFSEAMALLANEGYLVTATDFRRETKRPGLPLLVRRYGHYRYTPAHVEAVRAFARRERLVTFSEVT